MKPEFTRATKSGKLASPYFDFATFGVFYGRFAAPAAVSNVPLGRNDFWLQTVTLVRDYYTFQTQLYQFPNRLIDQSRTSFANKIRTTSAFLLHAYSALSRSDMTQFRTVEKSLNMYLDFYKDDVPFGLHLSNVYVQGCLDFIFSGHANIHDEIVALLRMDQSVYGPAELALWLRLYALIGPREGRLREFFTGFLGMLEIISQNRQTSLNVTPDLVQLVTDIIVEHQDDLASLRIFLDDLEYRGYHDLVALLYWNVEVSVEGGSRLNRLIHGQQYRPPARTEMFIPHRPPIGGRLYLQHMPAFPGQGMSTLDVTEVLLHASWTGQGRDLKDLTVRLQPDAKEIVVSSRGDSTIVSRMRHIRGRWQIVKFTAREATHIKVVRDDIIVVVEGSALRGGASPIPADLNIAFLGNLRESALMLQAGLRQIRGFYHVLLVQ
jgi:hypothetical protein